MMVIFGLNLSFRLQYLHASSCFILWNLLFMGTSSRPFIFRVWALRSVYMVNGAGSCMWWILRQTSWTGFSVRIASST